MHPNRHSLQQRHSWEGGATGVSPLPVPHSEDIPQFRYTIFRPIWENALGCEVLPEET